MRNARSTRRLGIEPLESRRMLAWTYTVDSLVDEFDGNVNPGHVSLRESIYAANGDFNENEETIHFAPNLSGTIELKSELSITSGIRLEGPGADRLTIKGGGGERIFGLPGNDWFVPPVTIHGLTLAGATTSSDGAAIRSTNTNLVLDECVVTGNTSGDSGGAISAVGSKGSVTVLDSTIAYNKATGNGGAIALKSGARLNVINSTLSGNSAADSGGALAVFGGTAKITNSTIARNRANSNDADNPGADTGGGIWQGGGTTTIDNSIVAANYRNTKGVVFNDVAGTVAAESSHNIIGTSNFAGGLTNGTNGNIVGVPKPTTVFDTVLRNNGGATPTHALMVDSIAIDAGSNNLAKNGAVSLATDQRIVERKTDGDLNGSAIVDVGAFEFSRRPTLSLSGSVHYVEDAPPVLLAPAATINDLDSPSYAGGKLVVRIATHADSSDRLVIRSQGNITVVSNSVSNFVRFAGIDVATFSGGAGVTPLVVTFTAKATRAAAQAVLRSIAFKNVSNTPPATARTITFVLSDNTRLVSPSRFVSATAEARNDPPYIVTTSNEVGYALNFTNPPGVKPLEDATLTDPDLPTFANSKLTVKITDGIDPRNQLNLAAPFVVSGNSVKFNGTVVGTISGGGTGATTLSIDFNSHATQYMVQKALQSVSFRIIDYTLFEPNRVLEFSVTDGAGVKSNVVKVTVEPYFIRG